MCDSRNYNPDNYIHVEIETNEDEDHNSTDEGVMRETDGGC